ncbi:MAG: Propeptide, PepSY amd peptidase [Bryobacterales bacterium]|nr:Propeptide, PepSY amd peptidase [Bryobacterales bacterium]
MTARGILLKIHLYLGLTAALFAILLGLTGSVIAFENDIPHWLHPDLFYVQPGPHVLPEQELVHIVEQSFAPAHPGSVQILRHANLARVVQLPGGVSVFVNQYNGAILGSVKGGFPSDRIIGYIYQIHLRLVPDPRSMPRLAAAGKTVVSFTGLLLCLLVPSGLILFWRTRRTTVKWSASWFRICFDLHHVVGLYSSLFLLLAAVTGVLIGFESGERAIFSLAGGERPAQLPPAQSSPVEGGAAVTIDKAVEIARAAIPYATVAGYSLPRKPKDALTVLMRVPEDTSETVHSGVAIDQYSGKVLQLRNFRTDSAGYYWVRFNRSLHTGDIWGAPSHILVALSSLLLAVMAVTGVVIWWRKLAA